jgi:hypothetical protein
MKKKTLLLMLAVMAIGFMPFVVLAGTLDPSAAPGPTMKTLDEIPPSWHQILPASERFELVMGDEAVLDKETGLVWARDANLFPQANDSPGRHLNLWEKVIGGRKGWRFPTVEELLSLVDPTTTDSALPSGHPFLNVLGKYYWTSSDYPKYDAEYKVIVDMTNQYGNIIGSYKSAGEGPNGGHIGVWPVRGNPAVSVDP